MLGDQSRSSNTSFSGTDIRTTLEHIGIKPEATRVALHRLKKDGWIDTKKIGREVFYQLSKDGVSQTNAAYEDVYRETNKFPEGWKLILNVQNDLSNGAAESNSIHLFKNVFLTPNESYLNDVQSMELGFDRDKIPKWFENRIINAQTLEVANRLDVLAQKFITHGKMPNELDLVAIRILFLHHWRKMALRNNTWAHIWLFKDGPISQYHKKVIKILEML